MTIPLERQPAAGDAPYLHWGRSRIQRLVAEGNNRAAIALSVQTNLICPLTAFVAWDESEKVPVATHDLIQPCLEVHDLRCGARSYDAVRSLGEQLGASAQLMPADSRRSRSLRFLFGDSAEALAAAPRSPDLDELELKRQFSDLCHRIGLKDWQTLLKAIFDWIAEASGDERARRLSMVKNLFEELKVRAAEIEQLRGSVGQDLSDRTLETIRLVLKSFVESLVVRK